MFVNGRLTIEEVNILKEAEDKFNVYVWAEREIIIVENISSMLDIDKEPIEFLIDKGFYFDEFVQLDDNKRWAAVFVYE